MEKLKSVLSFDSVTHTFGGLTVLDGLSFDVAEKDAVGIFGRSGSGKSTILKLAAGLMKPSSGSIGRREGCVGYVFQEPRLLPWKTALENVALPLEAAGVSSEVAHKRATEWLEKMELGDFASFYPAQLSGGMAQRVSLARAFAVEPSLLILDEPFAALDIQIKDSMFALLARQLQTLKTTVIYVSHIPEDMVRVATRILILGQDGRLTEMPDMDMENLAAELRQQ